ncbi:glycoside hydrolase family 36 protein [Vallitalea okinawensis]|uniref:glycoside hydrolase family 36 protein n=1 Tax=Vallitalea okinawensis TaxID=2078660 RepID=UPI001300A16B|nr:glycoside hydrolase family 36 protein [Vallitalea okinawensis]
MFELRFKHHEQIKVTYEKFQLEEGLLEYKITLEQEELTEFAPVVMSWDYPLIDAHYYWFPLNGTTRKLRADYHKGLLSKATISAPVAIYYNASGENRLTCALSDALNTVALAMGVREENGRIVCKAELFTEPTKPARHYEVKLRLDNRNVPYYKALKDVSFWWESFDLLQPSEVPQVAKKPMYSTWYSFHQKMTDEEIEVQCQLAKSMGCEAVIVDDGWQTSDNQRGYAYTGDWEVCVEKFPDMKAHVERVHAMGMKYLLWYSVPYIGVKSNIWNRFKDKVLFLTERNSSATLDPRFPDVREYLINIYEKALQEWDLDGFKLDFVDRFGLVDRENMPAYNELMDYISVDEAVDRLLSDVMKRLKAIKPDIMIEFRQKYIGPLMRKYGNIFRVGDCPADFATNRSGICDIRLISGNTVAHADMIMWNEEDHVESAALQINNIIFGVPQISMKLEKLKDEHRKMVAFWLDFYNKYQDVLLDGELMPHHPEQQYPVVEARDNEKHIIGVYADHVVKLNALVDETVIVNGKLTEKVYLDCGVDVKGKLTIYDCCGREVNQEVISWKAGLHQVYVPASGLLTII